MDVYGGPSNNSRIPANGDGGSMGFDMVNSRGNTNAYNRSQYYNNQGSQYNNGPSTSASALQGTAGTSLLDAPSGSGLSGSTSSLSGPNVLKSDSPSRKRRRISGRMPSQSPPALWEQRRSSPRMLVSFQF